MASAASLHSTAAKFRDAPSAPRPSGYLSTLFSRISAHIKHSNTDQQTTPFWTTFAAQSHQVPAIMTAYTNILSFDGGGTRGITSLLILNAIMLEINDVLQRHQSTKNSEGGREAEGMPQTLEPQQLLEDPNTTLVPQDVFDAVSGTSTGGLIALMIGRFGFTVEECIKQYQLMAKDIFGRPNRLGILSKGFLQDRYNAKPLEDCVRRLVSSPSVGEDPDAFLFAGSHSGKRIDCTVVTCRLDDSGNPEPEAVLLCSHEHSPDLAMRVWQAARATTAAPTYFEAFVFGNPPKTYIDGAFGHNNPTFDTLGHYWDLLGARSGQGRNITPPIRVVSIGTGQKSLEKELVSGPLNASGYPQSATYSHRFKSLLKLNKGAMKLVSAVDNQEAWYKYFKPDILLRHRLPGAPGVGDISLDTTDEVQLELMLKMTKDWLEEAEIKQQVKTAAQELFEAWLAKQAIPIPAVTQADQSVPQTTTTLVLPVESPLSEANMASTLGELLSAIPAAKRESLSKQEVNVNILLTPTVPPLTDGETQAGSSLHEVTPRESRAASPVDGVQIVSEAAMAASTSHVGEQFATTGDVASIIPASSSMSAVPALKERNTL